MYLNKRGSGVRVLKTRFQQTIEGFANLTILQHINMENVNNKLRKSHLYSSTSPLDLPLLWSYVLHYILALDDI